jgi:hypothetical protein
MITQKIITELFEYKGGNLYWKNTNGKTKSGQIAGGPSTKGYWIVGIKQKRYKLHRLIFLMHHGFMPEYVDHVNGNTSDNRIENLRVATASQNAYNSKKPKNNTSGLKNISWDKKTKKWVVRLKINETLKNFGRYNDIDYAKFVAEAMRYKYHQQFARSN